MFGRIAVASRNGGQQIGTEYLKIDQSGYPLEIVTLGG